MGSTQLNKIAIHHFSGCGKNGTLPFFSPGKWLGGTCRCARFSSHMTSAEGPHLPTLVTSDGNGV